ncbi:MAG: IS200/IS605 family transposase [Candidatus Marinimicrobia bacterium]|nr:IS200/IS605 family transposase [Candidatus Neomarinimicrobiota bacterium]
MALHSHVKIWIHLIWGTHNHERILLSEFRKQLFAHLIEQFVELNIEIEKMHIQPEHIHILSILPADKSVAEIAKSAKGESSRWINENGLVQGKFRWQRGYGAFSVSASQLEIVKKYIKNQETHHKRQTFQEEYEEWARQYGVFDDR